MLLYNDETFTVRVNGSKPGYSSKLYTSSTSESDAKHKVDFDDGTVLTVVELDDSDPAWMRVTKGGGANTVTAWIMFSGPNIAIVDTEENRKKQENAIYAASLIDSGITEQNGLDNGITDEEATRSWEEQNPDTDTEFILTGTTMPSVIASTYESTTKNHITVAMRAYGSPPQWTSYVDPRIWSFTDSLGLSYSVGRRFSETILSSTTVISLCPGIVNINVSILGEDANKADWMGTLYNAMSSNDSNGIRQLTENRSGSLIKFTPTWNKTSELPSGAGTSSSTPGYMAYLDLLSKVIVTYLGRNAERNAALAGETAGTDLGPLADRIVPGLNCKYSELDWSDIDGSDSLALFPASVDRTNYKYVNFYVTQMSTSEDFDTSLRNTTIQDSMNNDLTATAKDVAFLAGRYIGNEIIDADLKQLMGESFSSNGGGIIGSIFSAGTDMLRGGKIILPQVVDDCTYGKTCQFTCKFIATAGDVESIFWCELAPLAHLLPFVIPQQIGDSIDMYSYPFLCRAYSKGQFNCPMGVVKGFRINRGGADGELWSNEGLPMEIEVQFEITPLYSKLMLSEGSSFNGSAVTKFIKNTGLQEYVATLTGVDLRLGEWDLRVNTAMALAKGWINNVPDSIIQGILNRTHVRQIIKKFNELQFLFQS